MKTKVLKYSMTDEGWYSCDNTVYGISNDNSLYIPKTDRKKSFTVYSEKTDKALVTYPTRKECADWISKKTGKKVVFQNK